MKSGFESVLTNTKRMSAESDRVEAFIQSEIKLLTENRDSTKSLIASKYKELHEQLNNAEQNLQSQVDAWAEPMLGALSTAMEKAKGLSSESKRLVDEGDAALDKWSSKKLCMLIGYTKEFSDSFERVSGELENLTASVAVSSVSEFGEAGDVAFTPVCRRLPAPEKFIAKSVSPYSAMFMWSLPVLVRSKLPRLDKNVLFRVEQKRGSEFAVVYEGVKPTCVCDGLMPEAEYEFRVCAKYTGCDNSQWSEYSRTTNVLTKRVPVPSNFVLNEPRIASVRASWNFVPLPHGKTSSYQLGIQKAAEEGESESIKVVYEGRDNSYVHGPLELSTKYNVYLRSGCDGVWGEWEMGVPFTTSEKFPGFWRQSPNYSMCPESGRLAMVTMKGFYTTITGAACLEPNAVNEWSVCIRASYGSDMYIGFAPDTINTSEKHNEYKTGWYIYCNSGKVYSAGKKFSYEGSDVIKAGSTVSVHVDTKKGEASFSIDGKKLGVAFTGIPLDTPLIPVVLAYNKGDKVEILPYVKPN